MKSLSWIGTIAMFLVGGTSVTDGIEPLTHLVDGLVGGGERLGASCDFGNSLPYWRVGRHDGGFWLKSSWQSQANLHVSTGTKHRMAFKKSYGFLD